VKLTPSGRAYVSFVAEYQLHELENKGEVVALDIGVEELLVTSDGEYSPNLRPYERALLEFRVHRSLSRKHFLSEDWFKAGLARAYERLRNLRKDCR
jgi:putative transposase